MRHAASPLFLLSAEPEGPSPGKSYPFDLPAVRALHAMKKLEFSAPATFFVGENGSGKSTLLEALAVGCGLNAEGGRRFLTDTNGMLNCILHEPE